MKLAYRMRKLKNEAMRAVLARGHEEIDVFRTIKGCPHRAIAFCSCGTYVQVNARPAPNEIDIGGSAVAENCDRILRKPWLEVRTTQDFVCSNRIVGWRL